MTSALQAGSEESASWWSSSVSEVKTLERLIDQKLSKAVQLTGGMGTQPDFSAPTASAASGSAPTTKAAAAASAAAAVYTVTAAMDVSVLREEVGRLALHVQNLEGQHALQMQNLEQQPSYLAAHEQLEAKVEDLRRTIAFVKEQLQSSMRERQLEVMRQRRQASSEDADSSSGAMAAMRQELDDLRARMGQLSKQVEIQGAATADGLATHEPRLPQRQEPVQAASADVLLLRQELFSELSTAVSNVRREISKELRETAMEAAEKAAGEAAKDMGREAAKEAALRAINTNDTAREVLTEMVDKGTRPLKELTELLGAVREDVEKKQAAMHSEFCMLQRDLQAELSAAVAAMSKEVTTSCSETSRSVACCQEDSQRRHSELMSVMESHTTRFSKLRKHVETMRRDWDLIAARSSGSMPKEFEVVEADGAEPTKVQLCSTVATLQQQLTALRLKLQQVEAEMALSGAAQNTLKCGEVGGMADEASQRQREVEAQVQWLRTEAANAEPIIQSLKAECEELRSSLHQGLQRLATSSVQPTEGKDPTLKVEMDSQFLSMANVLAEEFDRVHTKKLGELAAVLGEEFDVAYQESEKAQLDEFRQKIGQLSSSVQQLLAVSGQDITAQQEVQRLAQELGDDFENVYTPRTNADLGRLNGTSPFEPICKRALSAISHIPQETDEASKLALQLSQELERAGLIGGGNDSSSSRAVQDKLADLPREVEKLRSDHDAQLAALAEALGDEFDRSNNLALTNSMTELSAALRDEFDRVHAERTAALKDEFDRTHAARTAALKDEFDRTHAERTMAEIQPIQTSLAEMQQNHDRMAAIVQDLQQQRDVACQEKDAGTSNADIGSGLCVTEVETLIDANTEFVDELQRNFSNLSNVVEDLLRRQISLASELEAVRRENADRPPQLSMISASPQGSLQCSPGLNVGTSQESTSDSKRELLGKRSPGLLSDAPSAVLQEHDAVSNVVSDLDCELSKAGGNHWDHLRTNLPMAMEGFRKEQDVKLTAMAEALGEEFEHIHVNHLSELAMVMGEEFDKTHAEKHEPLEGHVLELQLGHERLTALLQAMLERQAYNNKHTVFLDDFKPQQIDNVSGAVWELLERPNVKDAGLRSLLDAELATLHQKPPANQIAIEGGARSELQPKGGSKCQSQLALDVPAVELDTMQCAANNVPATLQQQALLLSKFVKELRSQLSATGHTGVASDVISMIGCGTVDLEALRQEQTELLSAMAETLGEEFELMNSGRLADMAIALGEDFDKLHEEKHQVLQSSLVELQQNQAKLAAIVLRQEYVASLTEYTDEGSAEQIKKPRVEFETLCTYVRSEIDRKLQALRDQLSQEVLQTLEAPRAHAERVSQVRESLAESWTAAHCSHDAHFEQLFRITQEQGAVLDDMRQQHATADPQTESPIKAFLRRSEERTPDEAVLDDAVAQVKVALFAGESCASAIESLAEMAPDPRAGATAQERALVALQLPKSRQQAALQQVMDNELCRARLALEGMPTFGALDANGCDTEPWDAHDQPDDADGVPLSGRWFAAPLPPVPPGLRAQASEDVSPSAQPAASAVVVSGTSALIAASATAPAAAGATVPSAADVSAQIAAPVSVA